MSEKSSKELLEALRQRVELAAEKAKETVGNIDPNEAREKVRAAAESAKVKVQSIDTAATREKIAAAAGTAKERAASIRPGEARDKIVSAASAAKERVTSIDASGIKTVVSNTAGNVKSHVLELIPVTREQVKAAEERPVDGNEAEEEATAPVDELVEAVKAYNEALVDFTEHGIDLYLDRVSVQDIFVQVEAMITKVTGLLDLEQFADVADILDLMRAAAHEYNSAIESAAVELVSLQLGDSACTRASEDTNSILPMVAMWTAGSFGTSAVDEAVKILAGNGETPPAAAWFDVATLDSENCSMTNGQALLALAGPIALNDHVPMLLTSIDLRIRRHLGDVIRNKPAELDLIRSNTGVVRRADEAVASMVDLTREVLNDLELCYRTCLPSCCRDVSMLTGKHIDQLRHLMDLSERAAKLLTRTV